MQLVSDKYYHWYNWIITSLSLILVAGVIGAWLLPNLELLGELKTRYGFSFISGLLALVQISYGAVIFRRHATSNGAWVAGLVSSMLFTLNVINLIHNTGQLHSPYMALWGFVVLASGMFGLYAVVGTFFLVTIYMILVSTGDIGSRQLLDTRSLISIGGSFFIGILSYFIWRTQYVDRESQQVSNLTGQLRSKQQQSEILIQSIADGIIVTTTDGKISLINPAAAEMTKWPVNEASGIDVRAVVKLTTEDGKEIPPDQDPFSLALGNKEPLNRTMSLTNRDGKHSTVSLVVSPVLLPKTQEFAGTVAVLRDISEERKEEKQRADFISTASHEMRTPVAAIEGYLALALNEQVSKIDTKARDYLEKAHLNTQHLGKLFQDLLTSAKAEDGRLVSHPVVAEMGEFLEQLTDNLKFSAEKKGLFVEFIIGTGSEEPNATGKIIKPLYYVQVDPDRLREAITNLFDNAVKYTESGRISIGLTGNEAIVQFYIRDTGPGIPADDIPHLFQKFYRVDNSATRTIGGTGLGLFICRKIVELYNGRIWVESQLEKGSTFFINLPRLSTQKVTQLQAQESSHPPSPLGN